ncbi:MAG: hypothetical protein M3Y87_36275 [Myxococcota bacterium]|nr:hypothetical protein [Myxococcota bacterium]
MTPLPPDWREFFESLLAHEVRFVTIGALAVAVHAEPRFSEDLDVLVEPSVDNAARLRAALVSFGFTAPPDAEVLAHPDHMLMIGRKPLRIDVLKSISGVTFEEAWRGRVEVEIDGLLLPVIGREELVRNKRAAGRNKDLRDVALLEGIDHGLTGRRRPPRKRKKT